MSYYGEVLEINDEPTEEACKNLKRPMNWNVTLGDDHIPLDVYSVKGHIHTIGGGRGHNDYYACRTGEEPSPSTLTPYNGEVCWSYIVEQRNYYRKDEIRVGNFGKIFCAGKQIYELRAGWDLMPHKIMNIICLLKEHPISFHERGYEKEIINRKIWYKGRPGIIERYIQDQGSIIIIPEDKTDKEFGSYPKDQIENEFIDDYDGYVKDDILSENIDWFRD